MSHREYFFRPDTLLEAIPMVGRSRNRSSLHAFKPHRHDCIEICVITGGVIDYFTERQQYSLGPGSIQISQPDEWHGLPNDLLHPCNLYWIHVETNLLGSALLASQLQRLPNWLDTGGLELLPHLESIINNCHRPPPHAELDQQAHLWMLLSTLVRLANAQTEQTLPTTLRRALDLIEDSREPIRVNELAEQLNTHRSHLHRLFANHLGVSPQSYQNERRLRQATQELHSSARTITDIAFSLGYNTTQHFATAFKARYGESPTEFRKKNLS
ncbi:helix-turn-helix transcriptional regulator [Cerasicoccus fimbriatus]|uniref:helix-turn-helix transcriptional regulator n=1 Tax=Cerasicoccus fimbriatus TaxID=3014554 RepID=UPI0022B3FDE8|nr:AraC family transcriptional regulator [Cerasicoccus sp. TK19100]